MAAEFQYTAKDLMGNDVAGVLEGTSESDVVEKLRARDLFVLSVNPAHGRKTKRGRAGVTSEDIVAFSRQLATMVDAGLPILQCMQILLAQTTKPSFRAVLEAVIKRVEEGGNFREALNQYPDVFGTLFIEMVGSGEATGKLAEVLTKVASYLEASNALHKKVKSAMTYPVIVTCICLGITTFMIVQVIPVFAKMYQDFGSQLPAPTQVLIAISNFMRHWFLLLAVILAAAVYLLRYAMRTESGKWAVDRVSLHLPIMGPTVQKITLSRFSSTLAVLVGSGLPILNAMEIIKGVVDNKVYAAAIDRTMEAVSQGSGIAEAMQQEKEFPPMVVRMIDVGEKTGKLEIMLVKISQYYDEQVNATISALTSLIEPFLIVFLGVVIGAIVIAMFMPIFKLVSVLG